MLNARYCRLRGAVLPLLIRALLHASSGTSRAVYFGISIFLAVKPRVHSRPHKRDDGNDRVFCFTFNEITGFQLREASDKRPDNFTGMD